MKRVAEYIAEYSGNNIFAGDIIYKLDNGDYVKSKDYILKGEYHEVNGDVIDYELHKHQLRELAKRGE